MPRTHTYAVHLLWTGNQGEGTRSYQAYSRDHVLHAEGCPPILGSSDPAFRGDPTRWNPEQLFLSSLAACHQLWYLHLCAEAGVVVKSYTDHAVATMVEEADGSGQFTSATLRPTAVLAAASDLDRAQRLHAQASEKCFLARSVNFPVLVEAACVVQP